MAEDHSKNDAADMPGSGNNDSTREWDYTSDDRIDDIRVAFDDIQHAARHRAEILYSIARGQDYLKVCFQECRTIVYEIHDYFCGLKTFNLDLMEIPYEMSSNWEDSMFDKIPRPTATFEYTLPESQRVIEISLITKYMAEECEARQKRIIDLLNRQDEVLDFFTDLLVDVIQIRDAMKKLKKFSNLNYKPALLETTQIPSSDSSDASDDDTGSDASIDGDEAVEFE